MLNFKKEIMFPIELIDLEQRKEYKWQENLRKIKTARRYTIHRE